MTIEEALARLRAVEQAASHGPWAAVPCESGEPNGYHVESATNIVAEAQSAGHSYHWGLSLGDAAFIAIARNALPALLDVAEAAADVAQSMDSGSLETILGYLEGGSLVTAMRCVRDVDERAMARLVRALMALEGET